MLLWYNRPVPKLKHGGVKGIFSARVQFWDRSNKPSAEDESSVWTDFTAHRNVWEGKTLPIGNGYMGGMIFGGVSRERIQLNEKTLWEGKPNHITDDVSENFRKSREAMLKGDVETAYNHAKLMAGSSENYGTYTTFGNLSLDFKHASSEYKTIIDP